MYAANSEYQFEMTKLSRVFTSSSIKVHVLINYEYIWEHIKYIICISGGLANLFNNKDH